MIKEHATDRLIIFRPLRDKRLLGCIRVYRAGSTAKLWDEFDTDGTFIGKIPKGCPFEAMSVEIKLITFKGGQS